MQDSWWIYTIICSVMTAMYILYNQIFKLNGLVITIYRGFGTALLLLPFTFFTPPVANTYFYVLCIFQGLLIGYVDNRFFSAARIFGADITSIIQPMSLIFIFIAWLTINPENLTTILENPLKSFITVFALMSISINVFALKKNKANMQALLFLLPSLLCIIAIDINVKQAMTAGDTNVYSAILYYGMITGFVAGLCNLVVFLKQKRKIKEIFNRKNILHVGIPIALLITLINILKNYSMLLSPNPAYVSAILYSYPIWIMLMNNYILKLQQTNNYTRPNKKIVLTIVFAVIILILVS